MTTSMSSHFLAGITTTMSFSFKNKSAILFVTNADLGSSILSDLVVSTAHDYRQFYDVMTVE